MSLSVSAAAPTAETLAHHGQPSSFSPFPAPSPLPYATPETFVSIVPGSALHSCLAALRSAGGIDSGCQPTVQRDANDHNNHFHLHLHNYLSSHSNTAALSSRMVACDRAIESLRPPTDRLFYDPLAAVLAGPELMEKALKRHSEVLHRATVERERQTCMNDDSGTDGSTGSHSRQPLAQPRLSAETDPIKTPRVAIRTRFFDDFIDYIAGQYPNHLRQLMLVGAGMDTRAYRLSSLQTTDRVCVRVYELDTQDILAYKNSTISSLECAPEIRCYRRYTVPVDLTSDEVNPEQPITFLDAAGASTSANSISTTAPSLIDNGSGSAMPAINEYQTAPVNSAESVGIALSPWCSKLVRPPYHFHRHVPSVWLLEGNLMYLTQQQQLKELHNISFLSSIGSFIGFSHINERALSNVQRSGAAWGVLNSTFRSCLNEEFLNAMIGYGWEIMKFTQVGAADANYGRWLAPVYPIDDATHGVTLYVCAVKVRNMRVADGTEIDQSLSVEQTLAMGNVDGDDARKTIARSKSPSVSPTYHSSDSDDSDSLMQHHPATITTTDDDDVDTHDCPLPIQMPSKSLTAIGREALIDSWNDRASAYELLVQQWPLFSVMAQRLIDLIPLSSSQSSSAFLTPFRAIDLGCGTGLVSQCLLKQFPMARLHLIEPAVVMMNTARKSLIDQFGINCLLGCEMLRVEDSAILTTDYRYQPVLVVLASALMNLCHESAVYPQIANLVKPGGAFIYNVWGHTFAGLSEREQQQSAVWQACVDAALVENGEKAVYSCADLPSVSHAYTASHTPPTITTNSSPQHSELSDTSSVTSDDQPQLRSFDSLSALAAQSGLVVDELILDSDEVSAAMLIDYRAMNGRWLARLGLVKRSRVIARARVLAMKRTLIIQSVRIRVRKPAEQQ